MRHINLESFESIQKNVTTSGVPVRLSGYYKAATIGFVDGGASADTLTDSASNFLKMGFKAGDKLVITGSNSNDKTVEIASVAAAVITLVSGADLTTEAAGATVTLDTLHGIEVPDGVSVIIKAKTGNGGQITVGKSAERALNTLTDYYSNYRLTASQSIELQVKNLKSIWIDSTVNGEGVEVVFEK